MCGVVLFTLLAYFAITACRILLGLNPYILTLILCSRRSFQNCDGLKSFRALIKMIDLSLRFSTDQTDVCSLYIIAVYELCDMVCSSVLNLNMRCRNAKILISKVYQCSTLYFILFLSSTKIRIITEIFFCCQSHKKCKTTVSRSSLFFACVGTF